jgi:hypothetical protein
MLQERGNLENGNLFVSTTKEKGKQLEVRSISEAMKDLAVKRLEQRKLRNSRLKRYVVFTTVHYCVQVFSRKN